MKIIDSITPGKQFVSLEFFPPKETQEWPTFFAVAERLARINPLFASVTYGAGGSTQDATLEIVTRMQREIGMETMAHLTCVGAQPERLRLFLDELVSAGAGNVLALRGDPPKDVPASSVTESPLLFASDLVSFIRSSHPSIGIGVAAYPEVHPEAESQDSDMEYLSLKLNNGADFVITQLFFDNRMYFDFVTRARARGITCPVIPGILPVVSLKAIKRIVSLCGAAIPEKFMNTLERADASGGAVAVQKAGIAFARKQVEELLAAGVPGIHLYTLNKAEAVLEITDGLLG